MENKLILMLHLVGVSTIMSCKHPMEKNTADQSSKVFVSQIRTAAVQEFHESGQIEVLGIVYSEHDSKPSFKTGGVIAKTYVKEGDQVRKGQLLSVLALDEINSQVQQAEEAFHKAERDQQRVSNLYKDSVATLEQLQNVGTAYEYAKKQVDIARFNRTYSEIRSPINGKIIQQILHEGEITGPGIPVFAILANSESDWLIRAGLIDQDWAKVSKNDSVIIRLDAYPDKEYSGYISDIAAMGGNASGTFDVEIKFKTIPKQLAAGLTAKLNIFIKKNAPGKIIPTDALIKSNGTTAYVFINDNGFAKKIKLNISRLMGEFVEISKGLEGISEVITTGAMYLEEGDPVGKQ